MAAWVQWFHPNGGTSPSKLVLVVIEEASATAQAMVKSGAPSVNHAVLGQALSALSESHPSTRVSFFPRPPALAPGAGNRLYKYEIFSSALVFLFRAIPSNVILSA